ncbi:hypothetical protein EON65_53375 [archaeon]|nr:MAG: hypothetical protein EON65_53375 [archaeon]
MTKPLDDLSRTVEFSFLAVEWLFYINISCYLWSYVRGFCLIGLKYNDLFVESEDVLKAMSRMDAGDKIDRYVSLQYLSLCAYPHSSTPKPCQYIW